MNIVGFFVIACVLLSLAQAALSALVIIVLIMLIFGVFYHPTATFGFLAFGLLSTLLQTRPVAAVWLISLFVLAGIVLSFRDKAGGAPQQSQGQPQCRLGDASNRQPVKGPN